MEDGGDTRHSQAANCGEMCVLHQWAITNPNKGLSELKDFWLVTVSKSSGEFYVKAPCNINSLGCERVVAHLSLDVFTTPTVVPEGTVTSSLNFFNEPQASITETTPCLGCGGDGHRLALSDLSNFERVLEDT